jgi:hypothetical protein
LSFYSQGYPRHECHECRVLNTGILCLSLFPTELEPVQCRLPAQEHRDKHRESPVPFASAARSLLLPSSSDNSYPRIPPPFMKGVYTHSLQTSLRTICRLSYLLGVSLPIHCRYTKLHQLAMTGKS